MEKSEWASAKRYDSETSLKWAKCYNCGKWRRTSKLAVFNNSGNHVKLCRKCFLSQE